MSPHRPLPGPSLGVGRSKDIFRGLGRKVVEVNEKIVWRSRGRRVNLVPSPTVVGVLIKVGLTLLGSVQYGVTNPRFFIITLLLPY